MSRAGAEACVERQVNAWRLFCACVQWSIRTLLGKLRPRSHLWFNPVHDEGAYCSGDAGKRVLSGEATFLINTIIIIID